MILLGSTGSIGVNTLNIARQFSLPIEVLVAGTNIALLNEQIKEFQPDLVVVAEASLVSKVAHEKVLHGEEGILEVLRRANSTLVVNALVGFTGLKPTIEAINLGKTVALANKESLVVAGAFIDTSKLVPIDSEHFGLWYLLQEDKEIAKMTITASGGSFRDTPLDRLKDVSVEEALNHPNWSMGRKITIDSATMTNKLFELLEAKWLFDVDALDAIIETKSIIHAMVDFVDGSTTAHIANADMRLPISYALMGKVQTPILPAVDLLEVGSLEFRKITPDRYPIWEIKDAVLKKPHLGAVINAANEVAIEKFFANQCSFMDIAKSTMQAFSKFEDVSPRDVEEIYTLDQEVRKFCKFI